MTPLQLLGLVALLALARLALFWRPVAAGLSGQSSIQPLAGGASEHAQAPREAWLAELREYLDASIVAGLLALLLITFVVRVFYIPSESMLPTLRIHDVLLVDELDYHLSAPRDGDIAVFTPPIPSSSDFIKRVVGVPGDTLRIHAGVVYRNGRPLTEPYAAERPAYELEVRNYGVYVDGVALDRSQADIPPREKWQSPDRIPAGCFFMLGDNRNRSDDSHVWGFAQSGGSFFSGPEAGKRAGFTGHALAGFWPLARVRILR